MAVVIIVILVALMFPLVGSLREKARSARCAQNLRQIGVGLNGYVSENSGRLPNGRADVSWLKDNDNNALGLCWYDAAALHMGRGNHSMRFKDPTADPLPDVFCCPTGHAKPYHPEWPYTGDYAANVLLGNNSNPANPLRLSAVKNPSTTPYVQDAVKQNNFTPSIFSSGASRTVGAAFADRHNGKGNILWVDGHVSPLTHAEYVEMANSPRHGPPATFMRGGR